MITIRAGQVDRTVTLSPDPWSLDNDLTLTALRTAIPLSGLFARFIAHRQGLHHLTHAAEQITRALTARAVETTGNPGPKPRYTDLGELQIIGVRVTCHGQFLLIEVWDTDPTPPQNVYLDNHLSLVAQISHEWSYYRPHNGGKVIWAELHAQLKSDR